MKQAKSPGRAAIDRQYRQALECLNQGRQVDAERIAADILRVAPRHADACHLLGVAAGQRGRLEQALEFIQRALRLDAGRPAYHYSLGCVQASLGRTDAAIAAYREAVRLNPGLAQAWLNLGVTLCQRGYMQAGLAAYRRVNALDPRNAGALSNSGNTLMALGRFEEAEADYRRALQLQPAFFHAHTNLVYLLAAHGSAAGRRARAELLEWDRMQGREGRERGLPPRRPRPLSGRRLRVGYVSPDLRRHAVSYFFEPLLAAHDREHFEVYCYDAGPPLDDPVRQRLRSLAAHWCMVGGMDDLALARRIREDEIDVLVDLAGHTTASRVRAFTFRPAPVQAAYLGFFASTGLAAMDYWITDEVLHPPDTTEWSAEEIVRLPRCAFSYRPPDEAPQVTPCPNTDADVVFGSFSNLSKLTTGVVETWCRLLQELPGSRLLVMDGPLVEAETREALLRRFVEQGVAADRLLLRPGLPLANYLACYAEVDIVLDPFPRTGGTTTAEALWMGVPVVTLAGQHYVERISASKLVALGLDDLVTTSRDAYLGKALELARDPDRRMELRGSLRDRMAASPLGDGTGLARALEEVMLSVFERRVGQG